MTNRIEYLDFLRGMAIITVVMGHLFQCNIIGAPADKCFNFIYSFHMGFFFFISGCTAALAYKKNEWGKFTMFVKKKARQLLLPYFVWGGVILLLFKDLAITELPQRLLDIFKNPSDDAPWFLFELFFIQVVYYICCALFKDKGRWMLSVGLMLVVVVITGLMLIKMRYIGHGYNWIEPNYFLLFVMGHFAQTLEWKDKWGKPVTLVCFITFLLIFPYFDLHAEGMIRKTIIKSIASATFSVFVYLIVRESYSSIKNWITTFVNYLGTHTLEIYLTHSCVVAVCVKPLIDTSELNAIPLFMIVFLTSIPICYLVIKMSDVLKMIPAMSLLLYGKI